MQHYPILTCWLRFARIAFALKHRDIVARRNDEQWSVRKCLNDHYLNINRVTLPTKVGIGPTDYPTCFRSRILLFERCSLKCILPLKHHNIKRFGTICIGCICTLGGNVACNTIRHCIEQPSLNYCYWINIGKNKSSRLKIYFPSGGDYSAHETYSYLRSRIPILWKYDVRGGEYDENIQMQCFYHDHWYWVYTPKLQWNVHMVGYTLMIS